MKQVILLHNPGAGDETHDSDELRRLITEAGHKCRYQSIKEKGWDKGISKAELLAVAGGDGTVRKAVRALLKKDRKRFPPISVLPLGTANNIARTLRSDNDIAGIIAGWREARRRPFDIGWVKGLSDRHFFIEGMGFGVFPALVHAMSTVESALTDDKEKQIEIALILLAGIIHAYKAQPCSLEIDGVDHSGNYLLVEIMNICSVGPNLSLSRDCDPGDHQFDVVMIPEHAREQLLEYVSQRLKGNNEQAAFPAIKGRNIRLKTGERNMHIDDKLVKRIDGTEMCIELDKHRLEFLV